MVDYISYFYCDTGQEMSEVERHLASIGYALPQPRAFPNSNRRGCVLVGNMLYLSGHGPHHPQAPASVCGKLGETLDTEQGYEIALYVALTMLATIKAAIGDLDRVTQVVRLFGMVNAAPHFENMPKVIDGASDLFLRLYGPEFGCHARSAVGVATLPRQQAVEINGEFAFRG